MRPTRALIHRKNLELNLDSVRGTLAQGVAVCAAVKANAYGHGVDLVAPWLADAGVEAFGVATVDEGFQLRRLGVRVPIFLFGTLQPEELHDAVEADLDLLVWSRETIDAVASAARGRSEPLRVHLKIDTGMGRVGCAPDQAEDLAQAIVHSLPLELTGVCTHFASSDGPGPITVTGQLGLFQQSLSAIQARGWTPRYVHAANSGGVVAWPASHFSLVRPGIALYGYPPAGDGTLGLFRPVMELVSRVGFVKTVPPGTPLSYGSRYVTSTATDVVTIPVGYADGYRRSFSNRAPVWIAGRRFIASGTVCMDQFMVDVGPNSGVRPGDPVVLFGPPDASLATQAASASELADLADTISYEILCGISARVPRIGV